MSSAHTLMKNRIYFELHVRHKGDNAQFYKVLDVPPLSIHRDAGQYVKIHTGHASESPKKNPSTTKKSSMIEEKYSKFPLCSLFFLYCPSLQRKKKKF